MPMSPNDAMRKILADRCDAARDSMRAGQTERRKGVANRRSGRPLEWNDPRNMMQDHRKWPSDRRATVSNAPTELDRLRAEVEALKQDCLTLALRLCSEADESHAPETLAVMRRWHPAIDAAISGGHSRETAAQFAIPRAAVARKC